MISVAEAKAIVKACSKPLQPKFVHLKNANGLVLAQDVLAPIDLPPFPQAAMDGYAFAFADYEVLKNLEIEGEVPAGSGKNDPHLSGKATRIFTGAPVPHGADTVVMQEKVTVSGTTLLINDPDLEKGTNVRLKGSEIKANTTALPKGTFLSPAAIGFLAALGITEVPVYPKPAITLIVTGNELQHPGHPLQTGQVYESNSFALTAALQQLHLTTAETLFVHDDLKKLQQVLQKALEQNDVVLLTGGVSVGNYDFVVQAATTCGVVQQFHKVAQRPGKPIYFGTKEGKLVFGLPGNPASVLTCFYQYVIVALEQLLGRKELVTITQLPLAAPYTKKAGLTHFLKGWCDAKSVTPLQGQESYKLVSFATANCFIVLDEAGTTYPQGAMVTVHLLPSC